MPVRDVRTIDVEESDMLVDLADSCRLDVRSHQAVHIMW